MNLKRYNEYLIAIVGTGVPLVILGLITWNLIPHGRRIQTTWRQCSGTSGVVRKPQQLALCAPTFCERHGLGVHTPHHCGGPR